MGSAALRFARKYDKILMDMANNRIICLGTDHAGYALKEDIKCMLTELGYEVRDFGAHAHEPEDDYPDFIFPACEEVAKSGEHALGIVFGGSGLGECIAANKVLGVRAAVAYDEETASLSRRHNNANVLALGGRTITRDFALARLIVRRWLDTTFSKEARHVRRIRKISDYEQKGTL